MDNTNNTVGFGVVPSNVNMDQAYYIGNNKCKMFIILIMNYL